MANMYEALSCSSMAESDDISAFLRQILLRSSSSSSSTLMAQIDHGMQSLGNSNVMLENQQCPVQFGSGSGSARTSAVAESTPGLNSSGGGGGVGYVLAAAANVSSSSVGTVDNENYEIDGYECESEEGQVEEAPSKAVRSRSSSKRGRAAEVHNMSEKRRRSRINEKMKALQNLIPNSNKTDKASMLDEAIEYLKQLQLQVQMLTMRNGLNLHPMYLSGAANRYRDPKTILGFYEGKGSLNMDNAAALPVDQVLLPNALFSIPDPYSSSKQTSVTDNLSVINYGTPYGLESSHFGSFHLPGSSKGIQGDETISCQCMNDDHPSTSLIDYHIGGTATTVKENTLQAVLLGHDQSNNEHPKDLEREAFVVPQMESKSIGRNSLIKTETGHF